MKFKKQVCVIVDAYSTGKHLAPSLAGYQCIHIQSSINLPSNLTESLKKEDFIKSMIFKGDLQPILKQLEGYHVKFCVPGSESGVDLADALSETLNLPTNGTKNSLARRNKYIMTQKVSEVGLKTVKHIQSDNVQAIIEWTKKLESSDFPVILKPIDSASGDNVHFCKTEEEVRKAFGKVINAKNLFGTMNKIALAQSFNGGQEYIVNSVSWEGKHFIAEIWRVNKKPGTAIYDTCEIIFNDEPEYQSLVDYTQKVLDALGIRYGAGTTELKYTPEKGAILIESAARLMGASELSFSQEIFGFTQLSLLIEAYLKPPVFLQRFNQKQQEIKPCHGLAVLLISDAEGILKEELPIVSEVKKLPTFFSYDINAEKGNKIDITVDMLSSTGTVYLLGNKEALWQNYRAIRNIEKKGVYRDTVKPVAYDVNKIKIIKNTLNNEVKLSQFSSLRLKWGLVLTKSDLLLHENKLSSYRPTL